MNHAMIFDFDDTIATKHNHITSFIQAGKNMNFQKKRHRKILRFSNNNNNNNTQRDLSETA